MASIKIIKDQCMGCACCVDACPFGSIKMAGALATIDDSCTLCGACVSSCPADAIELAEDKPIAAMDISQYKGIWVFAEQFEGQLRGVVSELLSEARTLAADLNTDVTAVLLGEQVADLSRQLIAQGADKVLLAQAPWLAYPNDENYCHAFCQLVTEYKPEIILFGATAYGRSLAPRISSRLQTGLTADCTKLDIDQESGLLRQTRPAFGGNLMATIICPDWRPQMATVRPRVFKPLVADPNRSGEVIEATIEEPSSPSHVKHLQLIREASGSINIADADILISVGKGIGNAKNIALAEELAQLMGGAISSSRPLVDAGIMPYNRQVGQTGKTVSPQLYLACGISGAIQHQAGMSSAEVIVAINNDPDAPIFQIADYGIVGDCVEVLQQLIKEVKELKTQSN